MKSIKWAMMAMLGMMVLGGLSGCGSKVPPSSSTEFIHFVDVYVNEDMQYVTLENDKEIGILLIFPGDYLIINNLTEDKVVIDLVPGVFETDELQVAIEGNKRIVLKVLKEAKVDGAFKSTKGDVIIDVSPKVKVGDGP